MKNKKIMIVVLTLIMIFSFNELKASAQTFPPPEYPFPMPEMELVPFPLEQFTWLVVYDRVEGVDAVVVVAPKDFRSLEGEPYQAIFDVQVSPIFVDGVVSKQDYEKLLAQDFIFRFAGVTLTDDLLAYSVAGLYNYDYYLVKGNYSVPPIYPYLPEGKERLNNIYLVGSSSPAYFNFGQLLVSGYRLIQLAGENHEMAEIMYNAGYSVGYDAGQIKGYNAGHDEGYYEGYDFAKNKFFKEGFDDGYFKGHNAGYLEGINEGEGNSTWGLIWSAFLSVFSILTIEVFPGITLGMFALIPLVFGLIGFLFSLGKKGDD